LTRFTRFRAALLVTLCLAGSVADADADWLFTPFVGTTFGGETVFLDFEDAVSEKHWIYGGSVSRISDGVFGIEGEFTWVPGMFAGEGSLNLVRSNWVSGLFGNVIAAMPLAVTRDSLRPYLVGGLGLVHIRREDSAELGLDEDTTNSLGLQVGGGALGMVSARTGLRFDMRHIRTLSRGANQLTGERASKLSFWRATVGVTFRY
jgi:opacity protein-like surface antigen